VIYAKLAYLVNLPKKITGNVFGLKPLKTLDILEITYLKNLYQPAILQLFQTLSFFKCWLFCHVKIVEWKGNVLHHSSSNSFFICLLIMNF